MGEKAGVDYPKAVFACGCFWSKEYFFSQLPGVLHTRVGFTGGHTTHPTYREVCGKQTGHAEAVEIIFDPKQIQYDALVRYFFEVHDPTIDRTDKGGQYRSAIFYQDPAQYDIAHSLVQQLREAGYDITTRLEAAGTFWEAGERHQQYCEVRGHHPQPKLVKRFESPPA